MCNFSSEPFAFPPIRLNENIIVCVCMLKEMGIIYLTTMDEYVCASILSEKEHEGEGWRPAVPPSSLPWPLLASSYVGAVIVPPGVIVITTCSELCGNSCLLKGL